MGIVYIEKQFCLRHPLVHILATMAATFGKMEMDFTIQYVFDYLFVGHIAV
jgi:hypothetical protein